MRSQFVFTFLALPVFLVTGCKPDAGPVVVHPVSGQIIYGEQPAEGVNVYLLPTSAPGVPQIPANPHGTTDRSGQFRIGTFAADDGAATGGYQVILVWPQKSKDDEEQTTDRLLNWYDGVHSRLNVEIKDGPNVLPPFKLPIRTQPPAPSEGVPGRN